MASVTDDRIKAFLSVGWGDGRGDGRGYGWGDGRGDGSGDGRGYGWGDGRGYGWGDGRGDGWGDGSGDGRGYGWGYGIKDINGHALYQIDDTPTIITNIKDNIAKGYILRDDLTLAPCYIAKQDGIFAHGESIQSAMEALRDKLFEDMPQEERISAFIAEHELGKPYPALDLYDWHHRLTGSCEMGRREFAKSHGIDIEHDSLTVERFIELTRDAYGGSVIRALEQAYKEVL